MLITLDEAKNHLQIDYPDADTEVGVLAFEASMIVLDYLKKPTTEWQDANGNPVDVPGPVSIAVKLVMGELFKSREAASDPISPGVMRLLARLRDPALA